MAKSYDARFLSNNRTYENQRANHFEVIIPGLGEEFTLSVTRCALPEVTIGIVELAYGNSKVKVAGQVDLGDGSLDVRDAILPDIEKRLVAWRKQAYNEDTGKMGWVDQYKRDIIVNQFGPDGTYVRAWKLKGAWITTMSGGDLDVTNPEAKIISLTIAYDSASRL